MPWLGRSVRCRTSCANTFARRQSAASSALSSALVHTDAKVRRETEGKGKPSRRFTWLLGQGGWGRGHVNSCRAEKEWRSMAECQLINPVVNRWCREAREHHDDFWARAATALHWFRT